MLSKVLNPAPERDCGFYFVDARSSSAKEFHKVCNQMAGNLKLLNEKILMKLIKSDVSLENDNQFKKEVNNEVANHLNSLSAFERNISLCYINGFEMLSSYDLPSNFNAMEKEFLQLKTKFDQNIYSNVSNRYSSILSNFLRYFKEYSIQGDHMKTIIFKKDFRFCNENSPFVNSSQKVEANQDKALLPKESVVLQAFYPGDETSADAVISLFYIDYERRLSSMNPGVFKILSDLCRSPSFQVKILDFCFTFLYSPDHLKTLSASNNYSPHSVILSQSKLLPYSEVYCIVAANILDFLGYHLPNNKYLLFQPRVFLEQYGLQALQEFKMETQFLKRTRQRVSIYDLLIGLHSIPAIKFSSRLTIKLKAIEDENTGIYEQFRILIVDEGEELMEVDNVITTKTSKDLVGRITLATVIEKRCKIIFGDTLGLIDYIHRRIIMLNQPIKASKRVLEQKLEIDPRSICLLDIQQVLALKHIFTELAKALFCCSCLLLERFNSEWSFDPESKIVGDPFVKGLKEIGLYVLQREEIRRLFVDLFELMEYFTCEQLALNLSDCTVTQSILEIIMSFMTLTEIQNSHGQVQTLVSDSPSYDEVEEIRSISELRVILARMQESRSYTFEILLANMSRKYQKYITRVIRGGSNNDLRRKEIAFLAGRYPSIFDIEYKKQLFRYYRAIYLTVNMI